MKKIDINNSAFIFLPLMLALCSFMKPAVTWVAIGDSMTYLNDHVSETGNRITKGYLSDVAEHFDGLNYVNKGFNGWTSGNIAGTIDKLGLVKADVYTILLGTNDWWQGRPLGNMNDYIYDKGNNSVYGSFRIIVNKIRQLNPEAKMVLITPPQRADFVYINDATNNAYGSYKPKNSQELSAFANAIDSIGQYEHIPVIDLYHDKKMRFDKLINFKRLKDPNTGAYKNYKYPEAANIPFNPAKDEYPYPLEAMNLTYDGLHPSDKGNQIIADRIIKIFRGFNLPMIYRAAVDDRSH